MCCILISCLECRVTNFRLHCRSLSSKFVCYVVYRIPDYIVDMLNSKFLSETSCNEFQTSLQIAKFQIHLQCCVTNSILHPRSRISNTVLLEPGSGVVSRISGFTVWEYVCKSVLVLSAVHHDVSQSLSRVLEQFNPIHSLRCRVSYIIIVAFITVGKGQNIT